MAGPVQLAIRSAVPLGVSLQTPTRRGQFTVARYTPDGFVLLLGRKEAWTPLPWTAVEQIPGLLRGRGWIPIGGTYSTESTAGTLDAHLKRFLQRATAGWVAVVLEQAGVILLDRDRPASVKLADGWGS